MRACSARPYANPAAETTTKSHGSSAVQAADAAAAVAGATSRQADRTARRSGPHRRRERRMDTAPVPPFCTFVRALAVMAAVVQMWAFCACRRVLGCGWACAWVAAGAVALPACWWLANAA